MLIALLVLVILCSTLAVWISQLQNRTRQAFAAQRGEADEPALRALWHEYIAANNHVGTAETLLRLALLRVERGEVAEAEAMLQQGFKGAQDIGATKPAELLPYLDGLIGLLRRAGRLRATEEPLRRALSLLVDAGSPPLDQALRRLDLGLLLAEQGRHREAEELLAESHRQTANLSGTDAHQAAGLTLARTLIAQGRIERAEELLLQTLRESETQLAPTHPAAMACRAELTDLHRLRGQHEAALRQVRQAVSLVETATGSDAPDLVPMLLKEAATLGDAARSREAEAPLQRALTIQKNTRGPQHPEVADLYGMLGELYQLSGRYDEAEPTLRRALKMREDALGGEHPQLAPHLQRLYQLLKSEGRYYEAEEVQRRILALRESLFGAEHPGLVDTLDELVDLQGRAGTPEAAVAWCERALAIRQKSLGGDHPEPALRLVVLAHMRRSAGQLIEAQQLYQRAIGQLERTYGVEHMNLLPVLLGLGAIHFSRQEFEPAHQLAERALHISEKALGRHHRTTVECGENAAVTLDHLGRPGDALAIRRRYTPELAAPGTAGDGLLN